jgi:predicted dehydrogenase
VEVTGIVSRTGSSAEALASEFGVPGVFDSIEELYAKTQASIVVVAVSEPAMKDVSIACLEFPWNLFIENPPGLTVAEVEELLEAAKERKRNVKIAFNRQNYSVT